MSGRDANSIGMVIFLGGVIVALVGPFLSGGKGHGKSFNWYVLGGLAMVVGAWIMYG